MTLVIKNNLVSGGLGKLYRDVMVSNGTLTLVDFSNKGCLKDENLTTVRDLALEAKNDLNIPNNISFNVTDRGIVPNLNDKKGYPIVNLGSYSSTANDSGLKIIGIDDYLNENQPHSLIVVWYDATGMDRENLSSDSLIKSGDALFENIRMTGGAGALASIRFGGTGSSNYNPGNSVVQVAVEYIDNTQPCKVYVNGKYHGLGSSNAYGFKPANSNNPLNIGVKSPGKNSTVNIYRMFIEDLDVSGRTALEVLEKDYNYVNALGEFSSISPRPFSNL